MLTDYERFLLGCYDAVVEINYENDDIYKFMDLMDDLGLKTYVDWLRKIDEKSGIMSGARHEGIKHVCFEFQFGKGFTYGEKEDYLKNCEETKVLSLNDLIKSVGKEEDYFLDNQKITLKEIGGDADLEILDDFCSMYDWRPIKCKKGFNILDIQFENQFVEEECFQTFTELVNRIVGRAIDYFNNEMCWDEDDTESQLDYGYSLLKVGKKYVDKNNENDIKWLNYFEKDLEELKKNN